MQMSGTAVMNWAGDRWRRRCRRPLSEISVRLEDNPCFKVRMLANAAGRMAADHGANTCVIKQKRYDCNDDDDDDDAGAIPLDALMGVVADKMGRRALLTLVFSCAASAVRGCPLTDCVVTRH